MSEVLNSEQVSALFRQTAGRVLITGHFRPDGDALGSLCGLMLLLRENGIAADGVLPENAPDYYREFLPADGLISEPDKAELSRYSLFVVLDSARRDRAAAEFIASGEELPAPLLNIDHHPDNPQYGTWNYVVPDAAATAEIIAELAFSGGWKMTKEIADHLLIGILTDTGSFRFRNTSPASLRTAARLMEAGGEYDRVIAACFFSKPENMARFEADLLCNHLKKAFGGRFIYTFYPPELLEKYQVELRNTEQVIEVLRAIAGPVIVATMRRETGGFKCSLRSKDMRYSVGRIARAIGGGGHEMAAGCSIRVSSPEEAEQILLNCVEKELNENPS